MLVYNENEHASSALSVEVEADSTSSPKIYRLKSSRTMRNKRPVLSLYSFGLFALLCLWVSANGQQIKSAIPDVARPLPLSAVRLTGGPLKHAQDLDIDYLLK